MLPRRHPHSEGPIRQYITLWNAHAVKPRSSPESPLSPTPVSRSPLCTEYADQDALQSDHLDAFASHRSRHPGLQWHGGLVCNFALSIRIAPMLITPLSSRLNGASVAANIPYATVLDGGALQWGTTAGNGPANLFAATDLASSASHNVSIMPASILDSVVVQMDLSADTEMTIDDSVLWNMGPSINVQGSWVANECLGSGRVNGTCHTSEGSGSVLTYEFQGVCEELPLRSALD